MLHILTVIKILKAQSFYNSIDCPKDSPFPSRPGTQGTTTSMNRPVLPVFLQQCIPPSPKTKWLENRISPKGPALCLIQRTNIFLPTIPTIF